MRSCKKCGCSLREPTETELQEVLEVLDFAPSREKTPNACVCRQALRDAYGNKRARALIELALREVTWAGTKAYPRRHVMLLEKRPLMPKRPAASSDDLPPEKLC